MRKIVILLYLFQIIHLIFSCTSGEKTRNDYKGLNESVEVKTYVQKVISLHDSNQFVFGKVILSADTLVPNYYIEYNHVKYRIDSHLYHQRGINFDFDIFENKQVSNSCYGSFTLFFGEPLDVFQNKTEDGLYHYTIFNISKNNRLIPSKYYRFLAFGKEGISKNDTIASLNMTKINNMSIETYFDKETDFNELKGVKEVNYMLRNGNWTKKPSDQTESRIMKHFAFILK